MATNLHCHPAHFHCMLSPYQSLPSVSPFRNPTDPRSPFLCSSGKAHVVAGSCRARDAFSSMRTRIQALKKLEGDDSDQTLDDDDRIPFNIDLAVILAGFAFEAYNTPDISREHEMDPFDCKTIFLSEPFLREVYEGQFLINLKKGSKFPGLDIWGTSDPYVVLRIGECVLRSKTIWATTEPVWDECFKFNVTNPSTQYLQIAAWDANIVTDHRRLGNSGVDLKPLSDGEKHVVELELEGMGGGGAITLEVQYQRFEDKTTSKRGWNIPLFSAFLQSQTFEDVSNNALAFDHLTVSDFLRSVLGSSQEKPKEFQPESNEVPSQEQNTENYSRTSPLTSNMNLSSGRMDRDNISDLQKVQNSDTEEQLNNKPSNEEFLSFLQKGISETFGASINEPRFPLLDSVNWDALDVIKNLGLVSKNKADSQYVESGLAIATNNKNESSAEVSATENAAPSTEDLKKASMALLKQAEETLKTWTVLSASLTGGENKPTQTAIITEMIPSAPETDELLTSDEKLKELEEARKMFEKAESAMEAWAVLATSLGHKSFVKSAFEKICFLDNSKTDTQVAIWRDAQHQRLVVAFRGTEQVKWKDIKTDLMLLPVSLNPERAGGEFKHEEMIHGGFLSAYDSVRNRLMSILKASIGFSDAQCNTHPWKVYVTGHSLGGALATLFALEISTSKLARQGFINVSMYNFGSPRVGNKNFAERYNKIVKDSWRVVNHRDIIPTVPRFMGYCHVAQPIYLTAGDVYDATVSMELVGDGYHADVIGEATPDFLLKEFMKGEKNLVSKLVETEIAMFRAIRDGSALMQHMEDFYYISLLESVSSRLPIVEREKKQ